MKGRAHRESWPCALLMAVGVVVLAHVFHWLSTGQITFGFWGP